MKPEWCPQEVWQAANMAVVHAPEYTARLHEDVARALLDSHQRGKEEGRAEGRREGMEEAAKICNERGIQEQDGFGLGREAQNYYRARDAIRAKAQEASQ